MQPCWAPVRLAGRLKSNPSQMKRIIFSVIVAAVCCSCLISCNEKPNRYRFVKVMDGKEEVETIEAKNDTDALKQYFNLMEKIVVANLDGSPYEAMYVISPDGDTLNTDEELMKAVFEDMMPKQTSAPEVTDKQQ